MACLLGCSLLQTAALTSVGPVFADAGPTTGSGALNLAETFDSVTGDWKTAQPAQVQRFNHSLTVMEDGRVLEAGGEGPASSFAVGGVGGAPLDSVEIYDPATDEWKEGPTLPGARYWHTATLLNDGRVLVVGGAESSGNTGDCEIYDPNTSSWSQTGALNIPRAQHAAVLLRDGRVLVAGGLTSGGAGTPSTEIYDPATGAWSRAGDMVDTRRFVPATLLPSGKVLIAGGGNFKPGAEIFDPSVGKWSSTQPMIHVITSSGYPEGRYGHTAVLLENGTVLVAGGFGVSLLATAQTFDPVTEQWTSAAPLQNARYFHAAVLLPSGKVLVSGGIGGQSAELYDSQSRSWAVSRVEQQEKAFLRAVLLKDGRYFESGGEN